MGDNKELSLFSRIRSLLLPILVVATLVLSATAVLTVWGNAAERIQKSSDRVVSAGADTLMKTLGDLSLLSRLSSIETALKYRSTEPVERVLNQAIAGEGHVLALVALDAQGNLFSANSIASSGPYVGYPPILNQLKWSEIAFTKRVSQKYGLVSVAIPQPKILLLRKSVNFDDESVGTLTVVIDIERLFDSVQSRADGQTLAVWLDGEQPNSKADCSVSASFLDDMRVCSSITSKQVLQESAGSLLTVLFICGITISLVFVSVAYLGRSVFEPMEMAFDIIESIALGDYQAIRRKPLLGKFERFRIRLSHLADTAEKAQNLTSTLAANEARLQLADQVAHDIKSPLAALKMMDEEINQLPSDARTLLKTVLERIDGISNQLLSSTSRQTNAASAASPGAGSTTSVESLKEVIEAILKEKRAEYRGETRFSIEQLRFDSEISYYASVSKLELKRILSNLINNSVESIEGDGVIKVCLCRLGESVRITISDNGRRISPALLPKLGKKGVTSGKENGSGLGLYHARTQVESWGGRVDIESALGVGTTVSIALPSKERPSWAVGKILIPSNAYVVVVDDDPSIYQVWDLRFKNMGIRLERCNNLEELATNISQSREHHRESIYLLDLELPNIGRSGIEIARGLSIERESVIVTNRADESAVRYECGALGLKLLHKSLIASVPIEVSSATFS